jgi:hypothetical protein
MLPAAMYSAIVASISGVAVAITLSCCFCLMTRDHCSALLGWNRSPEISLLSSVFFRCLVAARLNLLMCCGKVQLHLITFRLCALVI